MINRLLADAADSLRRVGAGNPRFEAELLLGRALQRSRIFLFTHPEYQPSPPEEARFRELLGRRLSGEPLQYVLGNAAFRELTLQVAHGVLIPRSETEVLVEIAWEALQRWRRRHLTGAPAARRPWVVDVGVGSGAILLALLFEARRTRPGEFPWFRPLGIDLAAQPLATTASNAAACGLPQPPLLQGDLLSSLDSEADLAAIVCNPPYISSAEMLGLPAEIREHEPPVALHGGPDGQAVIRALLDQAQPFVRRGALLCFEIAADQAAGVRGELSRRGLEAHSSVHPDLAGRPRVVLVESP